MVKDKYFPDIWKNRKVRVSYTLFHNIFEVFEEENCPNKNIYHTFALFSKKSEESIEDTINNLLILLKRPEDILRKILMILRKNIQLSHNFIWRNQTALLVILSKHMVSQKKFLYIMKNMLMLLFLMVLCYIKGFPQWVGGGGGGRAWGA